MCAGGAARRLMRSPPGTMRVLAGVVVPCMCTDGGGGAARWRACVLVAWHNGSAMHSSQRDDAARRHACMGGGSALRRNACMLKN